MAPPAFGFYQSSFSNLGPDGSGGAMPQAPAGHTTIPTQQQHQRTASDVGRAFAGTSSWDDEPPLLEELGIHVHSILAKTRQVLTPWRRFDKSFADEPDMAGPLIFAFLLGLVLLFRGKVHFGVIYGIAIIGCVSIYLVLNLMGDTPIDLYRTVSVLGYGLLPIIVLAVVISVLPLTGLRVLLSAGAIVWCTGTASRIFTAVLEMKPGNWSLVAYPVGLWYTSFALITIF